MLNNNIEVSEEIINSFRRNQNKKVKEESTQTEDDSGKMMDIMENDINRLRIENIKLEKALKQAQDNLAVHAANQNNTSSTFMLPSEFKGKWEQMVKENLPNAFLSLCEYPQMLVFAVQSSCLYVQGKLEKIIKQKTQQIAHILGVNEYNNSLQQQLVKIFQDNYQDVMAFSEDLIQDFESKIHELMVKCVEDNCIGDKIEMEQSKDDWLQQVHSDDMIDWFKIFWALMSYILLSNSQLSLGFEHVEFKFQEYKKNDFYCVDGFGKEGSPSLVVLPPVMRQNTYIYHGLKSAVLILTSDQKNLQERLNNIKTITGIKSDQKLTIEELEVSIMPLIQLEDLTIKYEDVLGETTVLLTEQNEETRPFQSQRQGTTKSTTNIETNEYRIKQQIYSKKTQDEQMKDTLEFITKLQQSKLNAQSSQSQSQSFDANKRLDYSIQSKESERFYMPKHLRTQNSRIENNTSFLGKINTINNSLAGKIVHQKSVHVDSVQKMSIQHPITNSSRVHQNNNTRPKFNDKENYLNQIKGYSVAQLIQRISRADNQPMGQRNSLEKLMQSFCQSQRTQGLKQSHSRAQSIENNSRTYKNLLENFSTDEEQEDIKKIKVRPIIQITQTKQLITQNVKNQVINYKQNKRGIKTALFLQKYKQLDFKVL